MTERDLYTQRPDMNSSRRGGDSKSSPARGVSEAPNFREATREKLNILFDAASDGEDEATAHLEEKLVSGSRRVHHYIGKSSYEGPPRDDTGTVEDHRSPEQLKKDRERGFVPTNTDSRTTDIVDAVQGKAATAEDRYRENHQGIPGQREESRAGKLQGALHGLLEGNSPDGAVDSGTSNSISNLVGNVTGADGSPNKGYHGRFSHDAREQLKLEAETRNRQEKKHDDRGQAERLLDRLQAATGVDLVGLDPEPISRGLLRAAEMEQREANHNMKRVGKAVGIFVAVTALVIPTIIAASNSSMDEDEKSGKGSNGTGCTAPVASSKGTKLGNISEAQKKNVKIIIGVGKTMKVPEYGWVIAIATAMQESNILVRANPTYPETMSHPNKQGVGQDHDSVGIFQQRPQSGWGKPIELMDAATTAKKFYSRLLKVKGWQDKPVAVAAQSVQISFNGSLYAQHEGPARKLVADNQGTDPVAVSGVKSSDTDDSGLSGDGVDACEKGTGDAPDIDSKKLPIGKDASPKMKKVILHAGKYLGTPYSWGGGNLKGPSDPKTGKGAGIKGFDCSSYVRYAYYKGLGKDITRTTITQWDTYEKNRVPWEDIKPGDLIYYDRDSNGVSEHVAMYIGNKKQVEEPRTGGKAEVNPLRMEGLMGALRPVETYS